MSASGSPDERRLPTRSEVVAPVGVALVGVAVAVAATPIADLLDAVLPASGRGRGLGTNFESFEVLGPELVRRTGAVILAGAAVVLVAGLVGGRLARWPSVRPWFRPVVQGAIALGTAVWYGWLARPHNAYPSNARYHWVDYPRVDTDNYFYAAGRIPHLVFYDAPYLWKAINIAALVGLLAWISNRLRLSLPASIAMCVSPAVATNLLLFADTAEDVTLNVTLLIGTVAALLTRRPVVVGLALALAVLGRPTFVLLAGCLVAAEIVTALRHPADEPGASRWAASTRSFESRFVGVTLGVFAVTTLGFQVLFGVLGRRYLFTNGRIIDTGWLDVLEPVDVDGFTISPLSGAYLFHLLWAMPAVLVVGAAMSVRAGGRADRTTSVVLHFCLFATVGILLAHELKPLGAYNIRYLTYVWPFLFVSAWCVLAVGSPGMSARLRAGAVTVLLLGLVVLPVDPVERRQQVAQRDESELLAVRRDLDRLIGDDEVVVTFGGRTTRNLLAYVIADDREKVRSIFEPGDVPTDVWVVTERSDPLPGRDVLIETDSLLVYAPD